MHNIVVMDFVWGNLITKFEPDSVQKFDLLRSEVWSVRPEIEDLILAAGKIELNSQLRFGIRQSFPGQTCQTRVLDDRSLIGGAESDGRRFQALCRPEYSFPSVGSRSYSQMDGLPFLLRNLQSACKKFLLFEAEELVVSQFVLSSPRTL